MRVAAPKRRLAEPVEAAETLSPSFKLKDASEGIKRRKKYHRHTAELNMKGRAIL